MKKRVLFVYSTMMLGGSTTSLLSLLQNFDYEKYQVDLLLYKAEGPFIAYIPEQVNILPTALAPEMTQLKRRIKSIFNGKLLDSLFCGVKYYGKPVMSQQKNAYMNAAWCRIPEQEYDVAIGFLELWSDVIVNKYIKAKKKISWVHVDYQKAHYIPALDSHTFDESNFIVHVSEKCMQNFQEAFPQYANKCVYIENILTKSFLQSRIQRAPKVHIDLENAGLKLLSVCRIELDHKGLDRGIEAIRTLKDRGYKINWYVIGSGPDESKMKAYIEKLDLQNDIHMLGRMECPFTLYENFDAFFVPSRYEGKPMAVTEAQMLGLPPIVTEYESAHEQIDDLKTGIIAENSCDGIVDILEKILKSPQILNSIHNNLLRSDFDNVECINQIYELMEKE